jgi:hypothetical protein
MKTGITVFAVMVSVAVCPMASATVVNWTETLTLLRQLRQSAAAASTAPEKDRPALQAKLKEIQDKVAQRKKDMYGSDWTRHTFEMPGSRKDRSGNTAENVCKVWMWNQ